MDGIAIFLNGGRGLAVVESVLEAGHRIDRLVVPATLGDRGPFELLAAKAGAPLVIAEDVNDPAFVAAFAQTRPRLSLIAGFPLIFRRPLIDIPGHGTLNLHGGRLPEYRGGSPLNWQIIEGEKMAGISVIRIDEGIDSGPVLGEGEIPIGPDDTIADLHARANVLFPRLVNEVLAGIEAGSLRERVQDPANARYWHQRNAEDGRIVWNAMTALQVHNLVRGVTRPYPGAFGYVEGRRVRIWRTALTALEVRGVPGRVCRIQGTAPLVVCADRAVLLLDYEIEGPAGARLRSGMRMDAGPA